jgi:hypothetical protein
LADGVQATPVSEVMNVVERTVDEQAAALSVQDVFENRAVQARRKRDMNWFEPVRLTVSVGLAPNSTSLAHPRALMIVLLAAPLFVCGCGSEIQRPDTTKSKAIRQQETPVTATTKAEVPTPIAHVLSVNLAGQGSITTKTGDFKCDTTCNASFNDGAMVTLVVQERPGWKFSGWSGACSGKGPCVLVMKGAMDVIARFTQPDATALNCTGKWEGSEETHKITAWPYRDCFRTDPVANRRIRLTRNAGGDVAWEQGAGWNGQNALRVRPPDGSVGRHQGYAGLGELYFHDVRTKRLNIRYLFRYNGNWARYAQFTKWEIAIKYDYSDSTIPRRIKGCDRGMVIGRVDPSSGHRDVSVSQGVCTSKESVRNKSGWQYGAKVRENEWISIENEFDLETGWYRTYLTTQDGLYNETLHTEINIGRGEHGAPAEKVPSSYWWGSIDCSAGCFWGWPDDQGIVPRPQDTYIWYSHFVMSNQRIGPPAGFVKGQSEKTR